MKACAIFIRPTIERIRTYQISKITESINFNQNVFSDLQMFERSFDSETFFMKIVITDIVV